MGTNIPHACIPGLVWRKQARRFSQFELKVGKLGFPIHFACVSAALYHRGHAAAIFSPQVNTVHSPAKRSRENVHQPRIWTPNSLHFAHAVHFAHGGQNLLLSFDCRSEGFAHFQIRICLGTKQASCSLVFFILFSLRIFAFPKKCTRFRRLESQFMLIAHR